MNNKFKKIKSIIDSGVNKGDFPGAQYCLIIGGKIECGFSGYNSLYPSKTHLKGTEVYDIASLSKIISTTTLILQLIEKNLINYDTKIKSILSNYKHEETTIYQLLTHQSGLPPIVSNSTKMMSKEQLINQIYDEDLVYEPEKNIVYSDVGYKLLGFVIEEIYRENLNVVAEKYIFKPLKMSKTTYRPNFYDSVITEFRDDALMKGYVRGYVHDERSFLLEGLSGHAGLFSTAKDIALFIKSILEDQVILKEYTKEKIFSETIIKKDLKGNELVRSIGYQKFQTLKDTHNYLITHTGFTGCNMWIDNKNKIGFVLLSNAIHPARENNKIFSYRKEILDLFYK